jgi:hypothetical protein
VTVLEPGGPSPTRIGAKREPRPALDPQGPDRSLAYASVTRAWDAKARAAVRTRAGGSQQGLGIEVTPQIVPWALLCLGWTRMGSEWTVARRAKWATLSLQVIQHVVLQRKLTRRHLQLRKHRCSKPGLINAGRREAASRRAG